MQNPAPDKPLKIPNLSSEAKAGLKVFWETYLTFYDDLQKDTMEVAMKIPAFVPIINALKPEEQAKQRVEDKKRSEDALVHGNWEPMLKNLQMQGIMYSGMGIEFSAWTDLFTGIRPPMLAHMKKACGKDELKFMTCVTGMWDWLDIVMAGIGEAYMEASAATIRKQEAAITELSTPVLKVRDRFLILPIIGILDTQRARQVTQALLNAIRANRAKAVVMDITGVPMVDSKVANHLVQTVEAARLMGATVIITGVSPEIAQTLVALGAELPNVRTFGDLQGGIEEGDRLLGVRTLQGAEPAAAEA